MRVFKFGGASVSDTKSIENLVNIVKSYTFEPLVVVVSAMGKTTRKLEQLVNKYFNKEDFSSDLNEIVEMHKSIITELFDNTVPEFYVDFSLVISQLKNKLGLPPSSNFDYEYDQIVVFGELFYTAIIHAYMKIKGLKCKCLDARESLKTNSTYRDAKINWPLTESQIKKNFNFENSSVIITQGFIASNQNDNNTTLGIEGSDFSAAIIAYALNVKEVVVWKDVPGFFNSDPKLFDKVLKLNALSFHEAVELAYYGAKIIHPKTIKPLQNKNIPLYVKSFIEPQTSGTLISRSTKNKCGLDPAVPVFITKNNQVLISIAPSDFSFIAEENLSAIFALLAKYRIKVNLMQNSAISFSICVDYIAVRLKLLLDELQTNYKVLYNRDLTLVTIRHYNRQTIDELIQDRKIYLQQKSRHTVRFVVK